MTDSGSFQAMISYIAVYMTQYTELIEQAIIIIADVKVHRGQISG